MKMIIEFYDNIAENNLWFYSKLIVLGNLKYHKDAYKSIKIMCNILES